MTTHYLFVETYCCKRAWLPRLALLRTLDWRAPSLLQPGEEVLSWVDQPARIPTDVSAKSAVRKTDSC